MDLFLLLLVVTPTLSAPVGDSEAISFVKKPDEDREPRWSFNYAPGQINIGTVGGGDFKLGHEATFNIKESPRPTGSSTTVSTTSAPKTTPPKPPPRAEEVARYDVCTPGPYLLEADCFCGKTNGKLCNKGFQCINSDCIDPDNEYNFPCGFDDKLLEEKPDGLSGQFGLFDKRDLFIWTDNKVPYYYSDKNARQGDKDLIEKAMKKIEDKTCFKFVIGSKNDLENKRSLEIVIDPVTCTRSSASVAVSDVAYSQRLQLKFNSHIADESGNDCGNIGLVTHELMHALGVGHTQRRSDRDEVIKVKFENFGSKTSKVIVNQYQKCGSDCKTFESIPYDCGSIMHYGTHYNGKQVIVPKDKDTCKLSTQPRLYFQPHATAKDYELLNIIGKCAGVCEYDKEDIKGKDILYCGSDEYLKKILEFMEKKK